MPEERGFILVAGLPGAGKSIVASVAAKLGLPVYTMGDVVREEVKRRGLEPRPENFNRVARELRERYGPSVIAERTLERIERDGARGVILIDGVRSLDEVRVFRRHGPAVILAVHASPRTRFERLRSRGRPGDPKTWDEFEKRDLTELSFGLGHVIALADYMLVNERLSRNEFEEVAAATLREVIRGLRDAMLGESRPHGQG